MSTQRHRSAFLKRSAIAIPIGLIILVSVLAFASRHSGQKRSTLIESELINITPRGFEPQTVTRPSGKFILMIENSIREELDLRLTRENGPNVQQVRTNRVEPDWNDVLDLPPGRYVLTAQSHPEWSCLITITPR